MANEAKDHDRGVDTVHCNYCLSVHTSSKTEVSTKEQIKCQRINKMSNKAWLEEYAEVMKAFDGER